jgi:hypothetical protein
MRVDHSDNTIAIEASSGFTEQVRGGINKVLLLNGDASSGLAALMGNLDAIFETPGLTLAINQREALLDLRRAAFGY